MILKEWANVNAGPGLRMDESKLIFFTGSPGSKWSATSHIICQTGKFNTSDYSKDRYYYHDDVKIAHQGAFFGPGNGIGERFDRLDTLSKDEILSEISSAYLAETGQYKLVRCHHFSLHLDFIKETFPQAGIIMVYRPDASAYAGWTSAGGFEKITYPNYSKYYKDEIFLKYEIEKENRAIKKFIAEHDLDIHIAREKYWKSVWGINRDTEELDNYMRSLEMRQLPEGSFWHFDVSIAHYNLTSILDK